MPNARSVVFDIIGRDKASPAFLAASRAAETAATRVDRSIARVAKAGAGMQLVGARLSKSLTLPVVAFAAYGAKQAVEFEKQMTLLRTAAGESERNMRQINGGIRKVSNDTATSLHDLSEGMYVVAKAAKSRGWTGAEQLQILKAAAQGAKSELVPMAVATDALSTVMTDYHSHASDAVKIENQLVKASGLAKTSFGEFSESLSNVTPIAAGLGISFAEVGGTIATMTQHGVSAQRATENLRNLMFNLAGQNNVASQAMQQLGIDTVDLVRNLDKRGLTGTLALVDNAMKAHTKNGMVVVDVQKASALATKSLQTEMGQFSGKLKEQSRGLVAGKTSIKDYNDYAKSLGGTQGAMALQYLALYKNALGFSNQLKSGKGTVTTATGQYRALLGGMTGASVAMQTAGKYAKDNAKNVAEVAAAAEHAGKNVHGWELTQKTLAYKLDDVKNKAALLATQVGQKLLPFLSKVADGATKAFHAFNGLGSGTKKFLGYGLLIGATLGPVLAILGRLTRGFVLLWTAGVGVYRFVAGIRLATLSLGAMETRAYAAGIRTRAAMLSIGGAARTAGIALAAIGIGAVVGQMTKDSSTGKKALGVLGSAGAGAALGFSMGGGPWGAALGGLAGGLSAIASNFIDTGDAAEKGSNAAQAALREQKAAANELLETLKSVNGAYSDQYKEQIVGRLQKSGALNRAMTAGIDPRALTNAALGGSKSLAKVQQQANVAINGRVGKDGFIHYDKKAADAAQSVLETLGKLSPVARKAERDYELYQKALGKGIVPQELLAGGVKNLSRELRGLGTSVDTETAYGQRNTAIVKANAAAVGAAAVKQAEHGKSVREVTRTYAGQINSMRTQLHQLGFTNKAINDVLGSYRRMPKSVVTALKRRGVSDADIEKYANKFHLIPPSKSTTVKVNDEATPNLSTILNMLSNIRSKTVRVNVLQSIKGTSENTDYGNKSKNFGHSAGGSRSWTRNGKLPPGYSTVGERGWELVHTDGRGRSEVFSHNDSRRMTGMPARLPGFASGTKKPTAAEKKQAAADKQSRLKSSVSTAVSGIGQAASVPFNLVDVGRGRVASTVKHAVVMLNKQVKDGLKKATAEGLLAQIKKSAALANRQLRNLRVKIKGSDLKAVRAGLKGTVDDTRSALSQLYTDVARSGRSTTRLRARGSALVTAQNRLASAKQFRSGVAETLRGGYDLTQSGSVADLITGLGGATSKNKAYSSEVASLSKTFKGNKSGMALLNTLAASGQSASLQSLFEGSKAERLNAAKAYETYSKSVTGGADSAELARYGKSIDTLSRDQRDANAAVAELAAALIAQPIVVDGVQLDRRVDQRTAHAVSKLKHVKRKGRKR